MPANSRIGVAVALSLALVSVASQVAASDTQPVTLRQTAQRVEGRCTYHTEMNGTWVADHDRVRDVVLSVDATVTCRGEAPRATSRQLYFASATKEQIATRLSEVASLEARVTPRRTVTFVPTVVCDADTPHISDIRCDAVSAEPTTASAAR